MESGDDPLNRTHIDENESDSYERKPRKAKSKKINKTKLRYESDLEDGSHGIKSLAKAMSLNRPSLRIETLKSSHQNITNWFEQF